MRLFIASALLFGLIAPAAANGGEDEAKKDPNQLVCMTLKETGSRLARKRVCMTRLQWQEHREIARDEINERQIRQVNPQG